MAADPVEIGACAVYERSYGPGTWASASAEARELYLAEMATALTALSAAGFFVVPVRPTDAMLERGKAAMRHGPDGVYRAMIAAAPPAAPRTQEQTR